MSDMIGFLHCHPGMEANHNVDRAHVIVDREDWEKVRNSQENIESPDSAELKKVINKWFQSMPLDRRPYNSDLDALLNSLPSGEHNKSSFQFPKEVEAFNDIGIQHWMGRLEDNESIGAHKMYLYFSRKLNT